jgi:hypothetical protein
VFWIENPPGPHFLLALKVESMILQLVLDYPHMHSTQVLSTKEHNQLSIGKNNDLQIKKN